MEKFLGGLIWWAVKKPVGMKPSSMGKRQQAGLELATVRAKTSLSYFPLGKASLASAAKWKPVLGQADKALIFWFFFIKEKELAVRRKGSF